MKSIWKGIREEYRNEKKSFLDIFSRKTINNIKSTAKDYAGTITGDPEAAKRFGNKFSKFGIGITNAANAPMNYFVNIPNRSVDENFRLGAKYLTQFGLVYASDDFLVMMESVEAPSLLFRGTSEGYEGNLSSRMGFGSTSVSDDPYVATLFAQHAQNNWGGGVLYIAKGSDLNDLALGFTNSLEKAENELVLIIQPRDFPNRTSITLTAEQARGILKEMGFNVPYNVKSAAVITELTNTVPKLTSKQIKTFYQKAIQLTKPK
jgi:hypothetical protein